MAVQGMRLTEAGWADARATPGVEEVVRIGLPQELMTRGNVEAVSDVLRQAMVEAVIRLEQLLQVKGARPVVRLRDHVVLITSGVRQVGKLVERPHHAEDGAPEW